MPNRMDVKVLKSVRGQSLVELALIMPLLTLLVMGIIDFGRLFVMYSAVSNAAQEAVRYGVMTGLGGERPYLDCDGIAEAARHTAASGLVTLDTVNDIQIEYDKGQYDDGDPKTTEIIGECGDLDDAGIAVGDRLVVTVKTTFRPLTPIAGNLIPPIPVTFRAARTILKDGAKGPLPPGSGPGGQPGGSPTCPELSPILIGSDKWVRLPITNKTDTAFRITALIASWPESDIPAEGVTGAGKLKEVRVLVPSSTKIYGTPVSPPVTISTWLDAESLREINPNAGQILQFEFENPVLAGSPPTIPNNAYYSFTVKFQPLSPNPSGLPICQQTATR